jgi:hypothetical protein
LNKNYGTIYIIKNKINNKLYVGQTIKSFEDRLQDHINGNQFIDRFINKYGIDNFEVYVYYNIPIILLNYFETKLIYKLNSISSNGYNFDIDKLHPNVKKVICLNTLEIFNYITEASIKYKINHGNIISCCKGKLKSAGRDLNGNKLCWKYYDDYVNDISKER